MQLTKDQEQFLSEIRDAEKSGLKVWSETGKLAEVLAAERKELITLLSMARNKMKDDIGSHGIKKLIDGWLNLKGE